MSLNGSGNVVVAGAGTSAYPSTSGAYRTSYTGTGTTATVSILNSSLSTLLDSTFLGGTGNASTAAALALDGTGNVYVTGTTNSTDFPATSGAAQSSFGGVGHNAYAVKLNGSLSSASYSTYLGGASDASAYALAVDSAGEAVVAGQANAGLPTTAGVLASVPGGPGGHPFVSELASDGTSLRWSTYLPGDRTGTAQALALDGLGHVVVGGQTTADDFPQVSENGQTTYAGGTDGFVSELTGDGRALAFSTYLGGSGFDAVYGLVAAADHTVNVVGQTGGSGFPVADWPDQGTYGGGGGDGFLVILTPALLGADQPQGSADTHTANRLTGSSFETSLNGAVVSALSADIGPASPGDQIGLALYSDLNGSPSTLLASSAITTVSGGGWHTLAISPTTLAPATTYWIVYNASGSNDSLSYLSNGSGYAAYTGTVSFGAMPSTWPGSAGYGAPGYLLFATVVGAARGSLGSTGLSISAEDSGSAPNLLGASPIVVGPLGAQVTALGAALAESPDAGDDFALALYTDSGGSPGTLLVKSASVTTAADADFVTAPISPTALAPNTTYWVAYNTDASDQVLSWSGDTRGRYVSSTAVSFGTWPSSFPSLARSGTPAYLLYAIEPGADTAPVLPSGTIPWHPHFQARMAGGLGASVDLADGHVEVSADDLAIAGRGLDLSLGHTWDSALAAANQVTSAGQGWTTDLTPFMTGTLTATVTYRDPTGANWPFLYTGSISATGVLTSYTSPAGLPWQLSTTTTPGTVAYTLTDVLSGATRTFNQAGQMVADTDSYGNSNTVGYSGSLPTSWTNSGGRALTLAYTSGGLLSDVQSPLWVSSGGTQSTAGTAGQHVTYAYQGEQLTGLTRGALTSDAVTDHFAYTGNQLTSVTTPMTMEDTLAVTHTWTLAYDSAGRVIGITSPISGTVGQAGYTPAYTTTITYNLGNTVVTQGAGTSGALTTTYTLDSAGEATQVTDGLSHSDSYTYDADHDVTDYYDGNNNHTHHDYQYVGSPGTGGIASTGLITQTILPAIHPNYPTSTLTAPTTNYVYDPVTNDLTEQYDNYGAATFFTYNGHHDISSTAVLTGTTVVGPTTYYHWRGQSTGYDSYGEQTSQIDGRGLTVPDTTSLVVPTISPNAQAANYTHSWTYTSQGDVQTDSTPPITTTLNGTTSTGQRTTQYTYDGDGDQRTMQSANNYNAGDPTTNATIYGYDRLGRQNSVKQPPLTVVAPGGALPQAVPLSETGYDGEGNVFRRMDANGSNTFYTYDPLSRLTETDEQLSLTGASSPITATTLMTYTATSLIATQDPQGNKSSFTYDTANRRTSAIDGAGEQANYTYDNADNLTITTLGNPASPTSTITRTYDALNRAVTEVFSGPGLTTPLTTTTSFDLHGNQVRRQDPNNDTTFSGYDLADQSVNQELDPGAPNSPTGAHRETFAYDPAGNRIGRTDFRGGITQNTLDGDSRQTSRVDSYSSLPVVTTSAGFDPDGNLVAQTQTVNGVTHSFSESLNPADWPSNAVNDGLSTTTTGDAVGDPLSQTIQNEVGTVYYNIDATGRDNQIGVQSMGASTPLTTTFAFNNNELLVGNDLPNNVQQRTTYDGANHLTQITATNAATPTVLNNSYQYGYGPVGWTTAITTTVQGTATTQNIAHDAAGRLTAVTGTAPTGSWSYDGRGNITSATNNGTTATYTYATSNPEELASTAVSAQPTTYYGYDGAGDTTSITNTSTLNRQLSYDAQARLTQITFGSPITQTVVITYTAFGQRAGYAVIPTGAGQPLLNQLFKYQGDQLSQMAVTGTSITIPYTDTYIYTQDGAPLELLRHTASTTTPYWYVVDGQGNVVALTDGTGAVVDSYSYDQWGKLTTSNETVPQRLRYDGYWYDQEVGWYWLSVRSYDPTLERFLQPDPSEIEGLFSYVYAMDNPNDLHDPNGLLSLPLPDIVGLVEDAADNIELLVRGSTKYLNEIATGGANAIGGLQGSRYPLAPSACAGISSTCTINLSIGGAASGCTTGLSVAFASQTTDPCTIEVRFNAVASNHSQDTDPNSKWKFHAYIITHDAHSTTFFRGGPRWRAGKRFRACLPFVGCTPYKTTYGPYLTTTHGAYKPNTVDWNPDQNPKKRITIANPGELPCSYYNSEFAAISNAIDKSNTYYKVVTDNSNSTIRTILYYASLYSPDNTPHGAPAPGWGKVLTIDYMRTMPLAV